MMDDINNITSVMQVNLADHVQVALNHRHLMQFRISKWIGRQSDGHYLYMNRYIYLH